MNIGKAAPWLLSVLLAIATGVMYVSGTMKDEAIAQQATQLKKMTADYNELIKDANEKVDSLVKEANEKIAFANLPVVPVTITTNKAFFASGKVVQIKNASGKTIAIAVSIQRPSDGKTKAYELTIDSGLIKSIGEDEGWAFIAGDTITVTQPEHKPIGFTIS